jgi:outer membrane lipoprotein-sorting protein
MRRIKVAILLLMGPCLALGQSLSAEQIQNLKAQLVEKKSSLESYYAEVVLETHSSLFLEPKLTNYQMSFVKPGMFRMEKMEGDLEVLVFNGDRVYHSYNGRELESMGNVRMASMMNEMITQIITGSYLDSEEFDVEYDSEGQSYIVRLSPLKRTLSKRIERIDLVLSKKDVSIEELNVYQNPVEFFSYKFNLIEYNVTVNPIIFTPQ